MYSNIKDEYEVVRKDLLINNKFLQKDMYMLIVYTKHWCGYCDMAKAHLNKHNIVFEEVNIDDDKDAREYMRSQGHRTAPQIYHNGKLLVEGGASGLVSLSGAEIKERLGDLDFSDISL